MGQTPTPDGKGVAIPGDVCCVVQPIKRGLTDTTLAVLATEIRKDSVPGLSLHYCRAITDAGLAHLKGLTSLTTLHLSETKITDAGLRRLKGITSLTTLALFFTEIPMTVLKNSVRHWGERRFIPRKLRNLLDTGRVNW